MVSYVFMVLLVNGFNRKIKMSVTKVYLAKQETKSYQYNPIETKRILCANTMLVSRNNT